MYNLRYHIASLVAVFLSLSIGLLLGTIVVERGTLDRQKEGIVVSLQEEFRTLAEANTELRERAASQEDLIDELVPAAISNELADRRVLVITGTGRVDGRSAVTEAIRSAGGVPVTLVLLSPGLELDDPVVSAAVTDMVDTPADEDDLLDAVIEAVVAEWTIPAEERPLSAVLQAVGAVRFDDIEEGDTTPVEAVVTLAPADESANGVALKLAVAFSDAGLPAVGAETPSQYTGVSEAAVEAGISGVDHIGTPEGTFSLVSLLSGRATGLYGYGEAAVDPWPAWQPTP